MDRPDESAGTDGDTKATPIGIKVVAALLALNGILWLVWSFAALRSRPTALSAFGPAIGVTIVGLGWGLLRRNWIAWALTNVGLLVVLTWETMQLTELAPGDLPILQLVLLVYLTYRQDLFFDVEGDDRPDSAV